MALHTVAAPTVWAAVKTELSYQNNKIIAFFFLANKNKDNVKVALASSIVNLRIVGLIWWGIAHFVQNNTSWPLAIYEGAAMLESNDPFLATT